jgi:2,3-bisphosphoglycerate-dependent phosphoglycerate mutase
VTVEVTFVRHGRTAWNAEHRLLGWADVPLHNVGEEQARVLGQMFHGARFDAVWSSDLARAVATSRLAGWTAEPDVRLREIDFGALESQTWEKLDPTQREALVAFDGFQAPGGESVADFVDRIVDFLDSLPPGSHLVVTHGGVIRAVLRMCGASGTFPAPGEAHRVDWTGRRSLGRQTPTS